MAKKVTTKTMLLTDIKDFKPYSTFEIIKQYPKNEYHPVYFPESFIDIDHKNNYIAFIQAKIKQKKLYLINI